MNAANKPTLIIGASPNPGRYSYLATLKLAEYGHTVYPLGIRNGKIGTLDILTDKTPRADVHTITMYVGADRQPDWIDYILSVKPKRIIFNPGAENDTLWKKAEEAGIECLDACTLVMLSTGEY